MKLLKTILCASLLTTAVATQEVQASSGSGDVRMFEVVVVGAFVVGGVFGVAAGYFLGRRYTVTPEQSPLLGGNAGGVNGDLEAGRQVGYGAVDDGAAAADAVVPTAAGFNTPPPSRRGSLDSLEMLVSPVKLRGRPASPTHDSVEVYIWGEDGAPLAYAKPSILFSTAVLKKWLNQDFSGGDPLNVSTSYLWYVLKLDAALKSSLKGLTEEQQFLLDNLFPDNAFVLEVKDNTVEALRVAGIFAERGEVAHQKIMAFLKGNVSEPAPAPAPASASASASETAPE